MRRLPPICALLAFAPPAQAQLAPPSDAGITFGHLHLNVADLELHKRIWVEHFGGELVDREPVVSVWLPGTLVMLNDVEPTGGSEGSVIDHVGFKVRDLDAIVSGWREDGLEVQDEFQGGEGARNAYLLTPDGLRIELLEDPALTTVAETYHTHFYTDDEEALLADYVGHYSLTRRRRGSIEATADVPGMNLSFSHADDSRAGTRGRVIDHIGFEVEGLEAFAERLAESGVTLDIPYRVLPGLGIAIVFYTDPSGAVIELTEGLRSYR